MKGACQRNVIQHSNIIVMSSPGTSSHAYNIKDSPTFQESIRASSGTAMEEMTMTLGSYHPLTLDANTTVSKNR